MRKKKVIVPPAGWFEVIRKDTMVNHRVTWTPLTLIYRRTYERPFGHFLIWLCWAERGLCTRGGGRLGVVGFEWSRSALSLKGCNRRRDRGWYREEMLLDKVSFFWWPSGSIGIRQAGLEKRIVSVCFYSLNSGQCQGKKKSVWGNVYNQLVYTCSKHQDAVRAHRGHTYWTQTRWR